MIRLPVQIIPFTFQASSNQFSPLHFKASPTPLPLSPSYSIIHHRTAARALLGTKNAAL